MFGILPSTGMLMAGLLVLACYAYGRIKQKKPIVPTAISQAIMPTQPVAVQPAVALRVTQDNEAAKRSEKIARELNSHGLELLADVFESLATGDGPGLQSALKQLDRKLESKEFFPTLAGQLFESVRRRQVEGADLVKQLQAKIPTQTL